MIEGVDMSPRNGVIREGNDCLYLEIEVVPGARTPGIFGVNEWRERLQVRVGAKAQRGKANK